jgi:serine/threonine-protein kinase
MIRCTTCGAVLSEQTRVCSRCGRARHSQSSINDETEFLPQSAATAASASRPASHTSVEDEGRFLAGTLVAGRYRIIGLLGRGGMGEVYRATDLTLAQSVALKFLPEGAVGNERLLERFHNEVRTARQVSHPNVCRVYEPFFS